MLTAQSGGPECVADCSSSQCWGLSVGSDGGTGGSGLKSGVWVGRASATGEGGAV